MVDEQNNSNSYLSSLFLRDDFRVIIDHIALNGTLTTEIIRLQDTFSQNNIEFLKSVSQMIAEKIIHVIPDVSEESAIEVACYLSGLHALRMKEKLAYIKNKLPHFAKWYMSAFTTNNMLELFEIDSKINQLTNALIDECTDHTLVNGAPNIKNLDDFECAEGEQISPFQQQKNKIMVLDALKTIHCKSNKTVDNAVKKYFGLETLDDATDVLEAYSGPKNAR